MKYIKKIKLQNYKRFETFSVDLNEDVNIFIGDNEAGKSTILSALDIVLSGSRSKIETFGLENIINNNAVISFLNSEKKYIDLPILYVEIYLNEQDNYLLHGKFNSSNESCDGLLLICEPIDELSDDIKKILLQEEQNFPFEYYSINFKTFSGEPYSGYRKYLNHILIDNAQINNEYATKEYVKAIYNSNITDAEKNKHQNEYRKYKENFKNEIFSDLNRRNNDYAFEIKTGGKANLETDLTISENNINIENRGKGRQCFIKTDFALSKKQAGKDLDIILIEEPENHLSHISMKKLVQRICDSENKQIFITTHNSLISTRLDLRKAILLNSSSTQSILLKSLPESTGNFFMKAPDGNMLEYILSKKAILVEGDAEYILMDTFFKNITKQSLEKSDVHVISVDGTSFKRYLDIAKILNIKTAVIRDNDGDYYGKCVARYSDYTEDNENIRIFFDPDNSIITFENAVYIRNVAICDELFSTGRKTLTVKEYMINNKSEAAFELLDKKGNEVMPPDYIMEAIEWIKN